MIWPTINLLAQGLFPSRGALKVSGRDGWLRDRAWWDGSFCLSCSDVSKSTPLFTSFDSNPRINRTEGGTHLSAKPNNTSDHVRVK